MHRKVKEVDVAIRKTSLENWTKELDEYESFNDGYMQDCATVIKAATIAHDKWSDDRDESQGLISVSSDLVGLQSLSLEHKSLRKFMDKTDSGQNVTAAMMVKGSGNREYEGSFGNGQYKIGVTKGRDITIPSENIFNIFVF